MSTVFIFFVEVFAFFHSLNVHHPGERAAIVSPKLPHVGADRCLGFEYVARGRHVGELSIKSHDDHPIWRLSVDGPGADAGTVRFM